MPETLNSVLSGIQQFWGRLSAGQRIMLAVTVIGSVAVIVSIVSWANRTEFSVLFSELDQKDAASIVEQLKTDGIRYELQNDGRTVRVPAEKVYDLRLRFAALGLPQSGVIGYELFDKNNIGVTDFVQKLNYRRALEGELVRTIRGLAEIDGARVHIVLPEPSVFIEQEKPPTASVALRIKAGSRLTPLQVNGIAHLIASSVEGLDSRNVTIVDEKGNILSDNRNQDEMLNLTATQLDLQKRVEGYLTSKVQSLLDGVLGRGNAVVRVTTELDFDHVERTIESYDPDSQVIRSEEISSQGSSDPASSGGASENTVTNYEINRSVERVVQNGGNVKRLSVAVMVNGRYEMGPGPDGTEVRNYVPRSTDEMDKLAKLVRGAVGFREDRGDIVEVTSLAFDSDQPAEQPEPVGIGNEEVINLWLQRGLAVLAVLTILFVVRSTLKRLRGGLWPSTVRQLPSVVESSPDEIPEATQQRLERQRIVTSITSDRPEEVAKLLRSWIVEEE